MKILIIPDVHGREFWIEPCNHIDEFDKVIFLGDYHDPYPYQVSKSESIQMLKEKLVPFMSEHADKVISLLGNHDSSYLYNTVKVRYDVHNENEAKGIFKNLNLKVAYKVDDYIFSHSGILPRWLDKNKLTLDDVLNDEVYINQLNQISPKRGGYDDIGSCIWGDCFEYLCNDHIEGYYQIFGHTQMDNPIIKEDFACLDCRKAFVLDTNTRILKEWDN